MSLSDEEKEIAPMIEPTRLMIEKIEKYIEGQGY